MLDEQNTEPRRNTPRRRQSGVGLLFSGILLAILACAVVVISTVLQETKTELAQLRETVASMAAPPPAVGSSHDAEALQEWIATLRSEVSESRAEATAAIASARREATSDRLALRKSLARILHTRGASPEEILSLVEELSPTERAAFQSELALISQSDPDAHGTNSHLLPDAPPDDDGPTSPEPPPVAVIVTPNTDSTDTTSPEPEIPPVAIDNDEPEISEYVVKPGDYLSKIARKLDVSEDELRKLNNISNPNLIRVGMTLKVPEEVK